MIGEIEGHIMCVDPRTEGYTFFLDSHEQTTAEIFKALIRPGDVVVDLGAHLGYFTLLAARLVGNAGKVFAFEPHPANYEILVRNIQSNNYTNVIPVGKAVSRRTGSARLYLSRWGGSHSLRRLSPEDWVVPGTEEYVDVQTTTLDEYFANTNVGIELVKMDIEGLEMDALEGMDGLLRRNRKVVVIAELNPSFFDDCSAQIFLDRLRHYGFSFSIIDDRKHQVKEAESTDVVRRLRQMAYTINVLCVR